MKRFKYIMLLGMMFTGLALFDSCYYDEVLPEPVPIPEDQPISFTQDLIPIFEASCSFTGCHIPGGEKPDLSPSVAYNSIISEDLVNVQDPLSSELYQWVSGNREQPMPATGTDPVIVANILNWIKQGAQNN